MFLHKVLRRKRRSFQGNPSLVGFSFLEIVISLSIIGVGMLGFMQILSTTLDAHARSIREIISTTLAQGLMAEIMSKDFEDPVPGNPLGPDEAGGRPDWDDVDDYLGYAETSGYPVTVGGSPMNGTTAGKPNYSGFTRTVTGVIYVDCVPPADCNSSVPGPTNFKKVTVQVTDPRGRVTELPRVTAR